MASGETLTDQNGTPIGTNTNPMFATFIETESGDKVKTSGTTLTGIDGNVQGTTANPLIVKIQDGTTPVDPNPMKVSGTTLTDTYGEPIGTNANPLILKAVGGAGGGKREFSGTVMSSAGTQTYTRINQTGVSKYTVSVSGLPFKPSFITLSYSNTTQRMSTDYVEDSNIYPKIAITRIENSGSGSPDDCWIVRADNLPCVVNATQFVLPVSVGNTIFKFTAYE